MKNKTLVDRSYKRIAKEEKKPQFNRKTPKSKIFFGVCLAFLFGAIFILQNLFFKSQPIIIFNEEKKEQQILKDDDHPDANYVVVKGDIPAEVFVREGKMDANDIEALLASSEGVFDFTNLKIGQTLEFFLEEGGGAKKIKYYPDSENMIIAEAQQDEFITRKQKIPYEVRQEVLQVKIDEFLYKDALDEGLSEASILEVADIFSFDIDFTTEIKSGDELKIVYEKRTLHGEPASDGKVLAARFTNEGENYFAYYFEDDDGGSHYDREGKELIRQFLRAPLSYRRITSGYTGARLHPITKTVTAHYQIDYAAPVGTPVIATARGTVASAGWEGGWGNMIRLMHDNGYFTHYGHLSGYADGVRSGSSVSQGQVIGYVGSTGWSTGPHLDYGMKLNGSPVNPLALKLPKGEPLSGNQLNNFLQKKGEYDDILDF